MESGEQGGPTPGEGAFRGTQIRDDGTGPVLLEHRQKVVVVGIVNSDTVRVAVAKSPVHV